MKVAVTGATGFLGSHLCRRLLADGHHVVALRRTASAGDELARLGVDCVVGDVTDARSVDALIEGSEAVFHAAACIRYGDAFAAEHERVNVLGTGRVARACRSAGARLVHVSSVAAIGVPEDGRPATEEFTFNPLAAGLSYHRSKHSAEAAVLEEERRGLDAVIVNPSSISGPWRSEYRGSGVPDLVARSRIVPYFVGGNNVTHVDAVIEGIVAALVAGRSGHRYILGGENLRWRRMAEIAAEELGVRRVFVPLARPVTATAAGAGALALRLGRRAPLTSERHRLGGQLQYYDSTKAMTELGYTGRSYREIIRDYLATARIRSTTR